MVSLKFDIKGRKQLQKKFRALGSRAVMTAANAGVRRAGTVIAKDARKIVRREAKVTGNLAKSIGVVVKPDFKAGKTFAAIGPRSTFKVKVNGVAKEVKFVNHPASYGRLIETGRLGRRFRRAGGVRFMARSFNANKDTSLTVMGDAIREKVIQLARKRGV